MRYFHLMEMLLLIVQECNALKVKLFDLRNGYSNL